ncbi:hypothetical protein H6G20_01570 [Desertifilum sp. FACHB-1129]|uniref:Uncharacterized protein n=1 Tax=Desertifilum tharense IPPAS B-1220 TaxID=1781255 RepID=A0A1E5QFI9_9CYAN|nr:MULTISPECIES: hypothetical protein [Desertifilum]MDA0213310.1 hypothetical protein [Cyanobacteria bacterium FC1]MBD2310371.1 hypothetical protein [Desertifilum sp. FACHB-1129]MBD2321822.1 hypothetical protein [Desertifilum sp. FACHB-866]MBD2331949.1 hypothetical protein [Desertifilum sp. FACHB-868]OEJ73456.1 hypothetical protein BH720_19700 [Desertifilum tharense IPPAS B-1220]
MLQKMITPLLKYLLVVSNPQLQAFILAALIVSGRSRSANPDLTTAILYIVQANCINIAGIISLLSGMSLPLVVLLMTVQGAYLAIDAHRTLQQGK